MPQVSISFENAVSQFVQIEYTFLAKGHAVLHLQLPAWRPGRYELANFAQYIRNVKVSNDISKITSVTKDKWRIETKGAELITVTYEFYAARMDAGSSYLDENQLYINPINCIPYILEYDEEYTLGLNIPSDFEVACALPFQDQKLTAKNHFELADSPFIASRKLQKFTFEEQGTEFHVCINGNCEVDSLKLLHDFQRYTKEQIELFGEFPCRTYHYLIQVLDYVHYHGVEHAYSTVITLGPSTDVFEKRYDDLLGISSHELFHTWNVCRIRPEEMVPYDLSKENYFETGYVAEGITTYYGDYMLARSGVFSETQFFDEFNIYLKRHFDNDGRHASSLAQSSNQLWLDGYKAGIPARKVSIYIKGALVCFLADVQIRKATNNTKSLDDVLRLLWQKHGKTSIGYSSTHYKLYLEQVSGVSFNDYFDKFIYGTVDLSDSLQESLDYLGCELKIEENPNTIEGVFGLKLSKPSHGKHKVLVIAEDSPASQFMQMTDHVLKVELDDQTCTLTISRNKVEKEVKLVAGGNTFLEIRTIVKKLNCDDAQKLNFERWLKKPFEA